MTSAIPGIETFHPRSTWEPGPGFPITGDLRRDVAFNRQPRGLTIGDVDQLAVHYTSAINIPDGDPGEILDGVDGIRNLLRNAHWDYLTNRTHGGYTRISDGRFFPGYPLGYSFAFDWLGGVWEINGFDYMPAATNQHNEHTLAFLMLTDRYDPASDLMWRSFRAVAREAIVRGATITPDGIWSHGWFVERTGEGTPTGCCGDALEAQIVAGKGDFTRSEGERSKMIIHPPAPGNRILDTREPRHADGSAQAIPGPESSFIVDTGQSGADDVALKIQTVDAQGNGWIQAAGKSVAAFGPGRGDTVAHISGVGTIKFTIHGAATHLIADIDCVERLQ